MAGEADADVTASREMLSFWGGVDPATGTVIDSRHPLCGRSITGTVVVLPKGKGSSTGSYVLLDSLVAGTGPAGIILNRVDEILALGAVVHEEFHGTTIPVVVLDDAQFEQALTARRAEVRRDGTVVLHMAEPPVAEPPAAEPPPSADSFPDVALSDRDRAMLAGDDGAATQVAMRVLLRMASIQQATELLDIRHVHIGGSIFTGLGSLSAVERMAALGATVRVPTTVNSISVDRRRHDDRGLDSEFARNAERMATALERMGTRLVFSCTPYVFPDGPVFGDDVLWAESNAIAYANSVVGARTNRHGDFLDLCAALTGRVPRSGLHLPENRVGEFLVRVPDVRDPDPSFFTTLGYLVGKHAGTDVPVIDGISWTPSTEDLKAFCATVTTSGPVGLFHMVGVTPEAPTVEAALGGRPPRRVLDVTTADLREVWHGLSSGRGDSLQLVLFGSPHATLGDLARLADLSRGRRKHPGVDVLVTTSRFAREQASAHGFLGAIEDFGMRVITDTCLCMRTEQSLPPGTEGVMTDSGKFAHYGPGLIRRGVYFGSTSDCVGSAVTGRPVLVEPGWLR